MENHLDDLELLKRFSNKETRNYAYNLIVRKYQERIYWHIRKMTYNHEDANDLTQDTFIKAYKGLIKFRKDSELFTWLYRIATNECLNFLKKKKRKYSYSIEDIDNQIENELISSSEPTGDEVEIVLQKALARLPEKQRLVFNMKYYDELKYEEISKVLKTSVGALKASYHHAVKKIESYINPD